MAKLKPQHQALLEILALLLGAIGGSTLLVLIIENGWFHYLGYSMIAYGMFGLLRFYYNGRVSVLTEQAKKVDK